MYINAPVANVETVSLFPSPSVRLYSDDSSLRSLSTDFLFIDGDHRAGRAEQYFEWSLPKIHAKSVIVLADIHWSKEMEGFWEKIRKHPQVKLSIDLLQLGVLFFDDAIREEQHLSLLKWRWKPWRLGFFGRN